MKFIKSIDITDVVIFFGFGAFSCGMAMKYGVPDMLMVSGGVSTVFGLFFARGNALKKGRK